MIRDLLDQMQWADAVVWRAVNANEAARSDQRVRDVLAHVHMTQRAFLTIWKRDRFEMPEFADANAVLQYAREYYEELPGFARAIEEDALDKPQVMPWAKHFIESAKATTLRETMLQVAMHSTYHRGQVNARLRELGVEPPLTDYIAWLWLGRPNPDWP